VAGGIGRMALMALAAAALFFAPAPQSHAGDMSARPSDTLPFRHHSSGGELAKGKFLVASRDIGDPRFMETVILLLEYGETGAMGLVINRPTGTPVSEVFPELEAAAGKGASLYIGGPVGVEQVRLLVRSAAEPEDSSRIFDGVYISSSTAVLERMARSPKKGEGFRVFAGYSGWSAGQLEREMQMGSWHLMGADASVIFDKDPADIWPELIILSSGMRVRAD
jgi:putative transcriptional regulator